MDVRRVETLVLVAVGGFAGAVARHALALALPTAFPVGTLVANVTGAFLLGVLLYEQRLVGVVSEETRLVAGTGFLSSFTTYSTFALETVRLAPELALLNVAANYALGFAAVLLGRAVTRWSA